MVKRSYRQAFGTDGARSSSRKYRKGGRRPPRSSSAYRRPPRMNSKSMLAMARSAVLKSCETKYVSSGSENVQLYHNGGGAFSWVSLSNLLATTQGNTQITRVGDEVYPVGLSMRLWLSNKSDRPNVSYRVYIVAVPPDQTSTSPTGFFKGVSGNKMVDYIDTDRYNVLYHKILGPLSGDYSLESAATNKEHSRLLKIWLPIKGKVVYNIDGGNLPKYQKHILSFGVIAYDAFGSIVTDNIASYAVAYRFYFKDP